MIRAYLQIRVEIVGSTSQMSRNETRLKEELASKSV